MALNLCILGNSHMAAFKLAWEAIKKDHPDVSITFFGGIKGVVNRLHVEDGAIVADNDRIRESLLWTSGGLDRITGDYDAFLLIGMGLSYERLVRMLKSHRLPSMIKTLKHGIQAISETYLQAATEDFYSASGAVQNVERVRAITSAPVFYIPCPLFSERALDDASYAYWHFAKGGDHMLNVYNSMLDRLRERCTVVPQPEETVVDGIFTKGEYCVGAVRLENGLDRLHDVRDYRHMNAEFGEISLRDALAIIRKALADG